MAHQTYSRSSGDNVVRSNDIADRGTKTLSCQRKHGLKPRSARADHGKPLSDPRRDGFASSAHKDGKARSSRRGQPRLAERLCRFLHEAETSAKQDRKRGGATGSPVPYDSSSPILCRPPEGSSITKARALKPSQRQSGRQVWHHIITMGQSPDFLIQSARSIGNGKTIVELFRSFASTFSVDR